MDINVILECKEASLVDTMTFPEVVGKLLSIGVERYTIDLVTQQCHYYGVNNEYYSCSLDFDPGVVQKMFSADDVQKSIKEIQQKLINYPNFLRIIVIAGCSHYEAFLTGKKIIYLGRDGSHHIEYFPQKK